MLTNRPWTKDVALFIARIALGVVFIAHGAQKLFTFGIAGTADSFAGMGVPAPQASALFAAIVELLGGAALVVGAGVAVAGLLLVLDMLGAFMLVHAPNGVFIDDGGFELVAALGAGALVLAVVGAGRFSIDHLIAERRDARRSGTTAHAVTDRTSMTA
ncbi:DoxX family protein [Cellulomonas aerilata]|uniref:Membrane protein n=1 Tax=Cellulomonas aerilata TaxID=515326 RepID=A0A512DA25_9CELL|nr:DoxX family protein [Cellulomonas aerilata]GEO33344.1 membrane protein [Cellulomonas aerilata]